MELLTDPEELRRAYEGALAARAALTWDEAGRAHEAMYSELGIVETDDRGRLVRIGQLGVKWVADRVLAALALVVLAPVFAAIWVWVRRDAGKPVFITQSALGRTGRRFACSRCARWSRTRSRSARSSG